MLAQISFGRIDGFTNTVFSVNSDKIESHKYKDQ